MITLPVRAMRVHSKQLQGGRYSAPLQPYVLSLDLVFTSAPPMPWGPSRPLELSEVPLRILVVAAPNEVRGMREVLPLREVVRFLLERGASTLAGGRLYARLQGDTAELWFLTDRWEDHALRLRLYELEAEAMREYPDVFVDLHVVPSDGLDLVPTDAHPVG